FGAAYGKTIYDFPHYDPSMFVDPPWKDFEQKEESGYAIAKMSPAINLSGGINFELRHFRIYTELDFTFNPYDYPESALSAGIGIQIPIRIGKKAEGN
ncbi:MAG TPA: hypothetical protein VI731_07865, partial [Bacteroidia bacterium]|nr:hypothetical protein [Bacteroidia bacterium]